MSLIQSNISHVIIDDEENGLYGIIKKLSDSYACKFGLSKRKTLSLCFEILLKKYKPIPEGIPCCWDNDDVLNAACLEIHKRCKIKNNWTTETCNKVLNYIQIVQKHKNSDYYQNTFSPALRMLLCIEYFQQKMPSKEKKTDKFFNTEIISSYLNNLNSYTPKEEMKFFSVPKYSGISHSQSEGNFFSFKIGSQPITFDQVFRPESCKRSRKTCNDLDEGFVTPNEDHIERSPCFETKLKKFPPPKTIYKFNWDYKVLNTPENRHKTWETYGIVGKAKYKETSFIPHEIFLHQWLSKAPVGVTKISRKQLLNDINALLIGVPSSTFRLHGDVFIIRDKIYTDELTHRALVAFCEKFLDAGTAFITLTYMHGSDLDDGVINSAFKIALKDYLYKYQTFINHVCEVYEDTSYLKYQVLLEPLIQQILYLKKALTQDGVLSGTALLKHLFDLMGGAPSSSNFYVLSSLFLLPCVYFFRLLDDWIFNGKWHKDLPLTECDMSLVNDRKSWVEAHKPIPSSVPWFLPDREIAHCGKAISLLSYSNRSEELLKLIKSNTRPKVRLCLDLEELDELKEKCEKYYEEGRKSFYIEKDEDVDLVSCARIAAQIKTEAFESRKMEEKQKNIQKKKEELCLRKEDLIRSAQNKATRKLEDDAINERVAEEQVQILNKEQQQTLEKAKLIYDKYKHMLERDNKINKKNDWKVKRHALDEKRREFLLNEQDGIFKSLPQQSNVEAHALLFTEGFGVDEEVREKSFNESLKMLAKIKHDNDLTESQIPPNEVNNNPNIDINPIPDNKFINKNVFTPLNENNNFANDNECGNVINCRNKEVSKENDLDDDAATETKARSKSVYNDENEKIKKHLLQNSGLDTNKVLHNEDHPSELDKNKLKILGSDLSKGEDVRTHVWSDDLEKNRAKVLGSDLDKGEEMRTHVWGEDLEKNRDHVLGSDLYKGEEMRIHIWGEDLEKNRQKVLGSDLDNGEEMGNHIWEEDLENNRKKVLGSDFDKGNSDPEKGDGMRTHIWNEDLEENRKKVLGSDLEKGEEMRTNFCGEDLEKNRAKVLGSDLDKGEDIRIQFWGEDLEKNRAKVLDSDLDKGEDIRMQFWGEDLERNRAKVLGSDLDKGDEVRTHIWDEDLIKNRTKVLGSDLGKGQEMRTHIWSDELEKNRSKVLGSDLGRGQEMRTHVWDDETERNKRNMMQTHFQLGNEVEKSTEDLMTIEPLTKKAENGRSHIADDSEDTGIEKMSICSSNSTTFSQHSPSNKSNQKLSEIIDGPKTTQDSRTDSKGKHIFKWLADDSQNNKMVNIFKGNRPVLIPHKEIDYALLNKLVQNSLKIVLGVQVKLFNEALLKMFLEEFELVKVTQKLRELFFLHGEYGKRLTAALSKAIEVEEPSTLLTFYRLRNILVEACRGDIKEVSFFVKDTPIAFHQSSPQVLSCLGLSYKFKWPLNLIFTDTAISKYNNVFEYMFSLMRVAWHLEQVWLHLKFTPSLLKGYQYTQIQLYRHVMLQFVCTLCSYIVTTVIESCWQDFIKDISKVKDLDELYRRHAAYIKDIKFKCFLDEKSQRLMVQIQKLLEHILLFCRVLRYGEWTISDNEEYIHSHFKKLRSTFSSFLHLARTVSKYVEKLVKMNYQKDLESLYYFLTINSFYIS